MFAVQPYKITYSKRKSISFIIRNNGNFEVKAPVGTSEKSIVHVIKEKQVWLEKHIQKALLNTAVKPVYSVEEIKYYKKQARYVIIEKTQYWANIMQASYGTIRIKDTKTRWGSCSSKNNLNFHWKLILFPPEVLEYVVIHEIAHIFQKNHSIHFWNIVHQYCPLYKNYVTWLKNDAKSY